MVREIRVRLPGPGDNPKYNIFHATDVADLAEIEDDLETFYGFWNNWASDQYDAILEPEIRVMNTATGILTDVETFPGGGWTVAGIDPGEPMADVLSVLIRWSTGSIVSGRFLRGRTFLPGLVAGLVNDGNVLGAVVSDLTSGANGLATSGNGLGVWSRTHGVIHPFLGGSCWAEFATQRGRRG